MGREPPDRGQPPLPDQVGLRRHPAPAPFSILGFTAAVGTWGSSSRSGCHERDLVGTRPNIATSSNTEMASCFSGWTPTPRTKLGGSRYTPPSPPGPSPGPAELPRCPAQVPCPPGRSGPRGCLSLSLSVTQPIARGPHCQPTAPALSPEWFRAAHQAGPAPRPHPGGPATDLGPRLQLRLILRPPQGTTAHPLFPLSSPHPA